MITLAHSPDSDDCFFFLPLKKKLIDAEEIAFEFHQHDTEELNSRAIAGEFDITAISLAVYPKIEDNYLILSHGASVGRNYGPVVVSDKRLTPQDLNSLRIGIPGETTTATALLKLIAPNCSTFVLPIEPYSLAFDALKSDRVDAILLIHEGQLAYRDRGLHLVIDLGRWWDKKTNLPLVLGINVIRRSLGRNTIEQISRVLKRSIVYSLENVDSLLSHLSSINKQRHTGFSEPEKIKEYLGRYANCDSRGLDGDCKKGIEAFFNCILPPIYKKGLKPIELID